MPDWNPSDTRSNRLISIGLVGVTGEKERFRLVELGIEPYVAGEVDALREAIAAATNMAVFEVVETQKTEVSIQTLSVYDELHDSTRALQCVLQDDAAREISAYVTGVHHSLLLSDTITLIAGDSGAASGTPARIVADLKIAIENVVNNSFDPAANFEFVRGILRPHKVDLGNFQVRPQIAEP